MRIPKTNQEVSLMAVITGTGAALTGIGTIVGGWLWVDSHFANKNEVKAVETQVIAMEQKSVIQEWNFEQAQNAILLDVYEDRKERELRKPDMDPSRVEKYNKRIDRLEIRQDQLQLLMDQNRL